MAAGSWTPYSNAVLNLSKKLIDLSADTFVLALITNSYVPAPNTDALWSAVSANELGTGGGYTAGGVVLGSVTDTLATATVTFTCANPTWATFSAGPFRYGVIARRAGVSLVAGDLLLAYSDLGGGATLTGVGSTFTVTISGSGIIAWTHSP
jgi:hypothetical protein